MKKISALIILITILFSVTACGDEKANESIKTNEYKQITQEEAKEIMDSGSSYILLDVRTEEEFNDGHIKGAVLIPDYEIESRAEEILTDKSETILVYCRSGNRSKKASEKLASMGYTNVLEFGGIIDWQYDIEK